MATVSPPRKPDGRALRSAATRQAVAGAYLDLLMSGNPRPTAKEVAARSGVSERAVFRHFQDMETLFSEAATLQIQRMADEIHPPAPLEGPLPLRIEAFARRWCGLHERVTPVRRVAVASEATSPEIAKRLGWIRSVERAEIEATFAPELAALDGERHRQTVAAVCAAGSWECWNEFRTRSRLDAAASERAVRFTLAALLAACTS